MNDEGIANELPPELQLNGLFSTAALEVVQLLLLVLALIALCSLAFTLLDLILLCREMYKTRPQRPTSKRRRSSRRAALV
jgi:hypothetical protein